MTDTRQIPLTRGYTAIVDADDYEWLSAFKWSALASRRRIYAARGTEIGGIKRTILMHREILAVEDSLFVDHRDNDPLNNTRANLRCASVGQNNANRHKCSTKGAGSSSRFKGVIHLPGGRWRAYVGTGKNRRYLGIFDTEIEAGRAYNCAAVETYGEFACLNPIEGGACC